MTFDPTLPLATEGFAQSQVDVTTNFNQTNIVFNANHVNFNDATVVDRGKHRQIIAKAVAVPATIAGEGAVYVANSGGTREQLRYRRESNGIVIGLTEWMGASCTFVGATGAISQSFNIAGIVRTAQGRYTVTFTTALVAATYGVLVSPRVDAAGSVWSVTTANHGVGGFDIRVKALNDTYQDPTSCSFIVVGEIS